MSPKSYFRNIYDNVTSIAIGMKITLKYCFQKTVTVQYPEQHLSFAPRYRGIHEFEADRCIACDMCAKACPVDCIYIDKTAARKIDKKTGKVDPKGGVLLRYAIDTQSACSAHCAPSRARPTAFTWASCTTSAHIRAKTSSSNSPSWTNRVCARR